MPISLSFYPIFFSLPSRFSYIKIINSRCHMHCISSRFPFQLSFNYCCIDLCAFLQSHIIEYMLAFCCLLQKSTLISPIYCVDVEHCFEFSFDLAFITLQYNINWSELGGWWPHHVQYFSTTQKDTKGWSLFREEKNVIAGYKKEYCKLTMKDLRVKFLCEYILSNMFNYWEGKGRCLNNEMERKQWMKVWYPSHIKEACTKFKILNRYWLAEYVWNNWHPYTTMAVLPELLY